MVALNRERPPFDPSCAVFAEDVLAEIAELRAHGKSWQEVAAAVRWDADELRKTVKTDPNYRPALARARREAEDEANDEGLAHLRKLTQDADPEVALEAHRIVTRYLTEKDRNRTRRAVERMRLQAALARAATRPAKQQNEQPVDEDAPRVDPVDGGVMCSIREEREMKEAQAAFQQELASEIADAGAAVWLWAGDHKVHDHEPGPNDTPLRIIPTTDARVAGKRIFWAVAVPPPTDPLMGPLLRPEECKRVPPVEEEVWQRILERHRPAAGGAGAPSEKE